MQKSIFIKRTNLRACFGALWLLSSLFLSVTNGFGTNILTSNEREWLQLNRESLTVGSELGFRPISFVHKNRMAGFTWDYIELLEEKLGFQFNRQQPEPFHVLIEQFKRKEIAILPDLHRNKEREKYIDFTPPYLYVPMVFISKNLQDRVLQLNNKEKQYTVTVAKNTIAQQYLTRKYDHLTIFPKDTEVDSLLDVSAGFADAAFISLATAIVTIEAQGLSGLKIDSELGLNQELHLGVRKDLPELTTILNKGVAAIEQKEIDRLYDKWIPQNEGPYYTRKDFKRGVFFFLSGILALFALTILWNIRLRVEVRKREAFLNDQHISLQKEITARKVEEQKLEARQAHLRAILNTIPDMIWFKGLGGENSFHNQKFAKYHNGQDGVQPQITDQQVIDIGNPVVGEESIVYGTQKQHLFFEIIRLPVISQESSPLGVLGIGRDISEMKKIEKELTNFKEQIETLLTDIDGFTFRIINDDLLTINFISSHIERFTGINSELYKDRPLSNLNIHEKDTGLKQVIRQLKIVIQKGVPVERDIKMLHADGDLFWVRVAMFPVFGLDEQVEYVDGIATNVTKYKVLERHLDQTRQMESAGLVAGGIAHDFNNLLTGVLGFSDLLKEDLQDFGATEEQKLAINNMLTGGKRAKDLIAQILRFTRKDETQQSLVDIGDIGREVVKLLRATLPNSVQFETDFSSRILVKASAEHVRQLMIKLCTNSVRTMGTVNGIVFISLYERYIEDQTGDKMEIEPGVYLQLTIENGCQGEDAKNFSNEINHSSMADPEQENQKMGLWNANEIVKELGGKLNIVHSSGIECRFEVLLPLPEETESNVSTEKLLVLGKRILFIDKEKTLTQFMKDIMEANGHRVEVCNSGTEALVKLKSPGDHYDLLITEIDLHDISANGLLKQVKKAAPMTKTIITATPPYDILNNALQYEAILEKPYSITDFEQTIQRVFLK